MSKISLLRKSLLHGILKVNIFTIAYKAEIYALPSRVHPSRVET